MRTYARIDTGAVAELFETDGDITTMFNPTLIWVDVTDDSPQPQCGWTASDESGDWVLTGPAAPTAAEIAAQRNAELTAQMDTIERQYLMNRGVREFCIAAIMLQATTVGKTEAWLLDPQTGNPFYIKLIAVDTQIRAIRSQLQ